MSRVLPRQPAPDLAAPTLSGTTWSLAAAAPERFSLIVFYRTHFGSFGNLFDHVLKKRDKNLKTVWVQTDLARVNLATDEGSVAHFDIHQAGCASHARRPFALYEDEDPDWCAFILHEFKGLFIHEKGLDLHGRNKENVLAIRQNDSKKVWDTILEYCQMVSKKWSQKTKLGLASRYVEKNFDRLTAYLANPRVDLTNNFSERMLRAEKLIQASSLFRTTLEGRFALDIVRTVTQTAIASDVDVKEYLMFVLKSNPTDVRENPEKYLPKVFREMHPPQEPA